ncbi:MAG: hypothetical protein E6R14_04230, partial [Thermomicrobiales bacterium]
GRADRSLQAHLRACAARRDLSGAAGDRYPDDLPPAGHQILLERGAFDTESMILVAYGLQFYMIGLIFHSMLEIIVRGFYALQDTWTPVLVGILAMVANIGLSFMLVGRLSFGGLALANSLATMAESLVLLWLLNRRVPGRLNWNVLTPALVKMAIAAALMALAAWAWGRWVYLNVFLGDVLPVNDDWLTALVGVPLALLLYLGVLWLLRSDEWRETVALVRRRRGTGEQS